MLGLFLPTRGVSPPHSGAATPTNAPPIPVKKKNSLHRRKGLAVYDQPPDWWDHWQN